MLCLCLLGLCFYDWLYLLGSSWFDWLVGFDGVVCFIGVCFRCCYLHLGWFVIIVALIKV